MPIFTKLIYHRTFEVDIVVGKRCSGDIIHLDARHFLHMKAFC